MDSYKRTALRSEIGTEAQDLRMILAISQRVLPQV